jgi:hypothetical protein
MDPDPGAQKHVDPVDPDPNSDPEHCPEGKLQTRNSDHFHQGSVVCLLFASIADKNRGVNERICLGWVIYFAVFLSSFFMTCRKNSFCNLKKQDKGDFSDLFLSQYVSKRKIKL